MYLCAQSAVAAAAATVLCVAILLLLQLLLLAAAVRHRVPDGNICWFIESSSSILFLFIQTRFIFNVPFGSMVAFTTSTRL